MSNINPQSIDGTYPIAGQDNNSQGFRDNFTNTVNNFTFAAAELNDLQQNAVVKAALGSVGQSATPTNDLNYAYITHAQMIGTVETKKAFGNVLVGGSIPIDWAQGHFQTADLVGANATVSFGSTWPATNLYTRLRLQCNTYTVSCNLALPAAVSTNISSIQGASGQTINLPAGGVYVFEFSTWNNGATIAIQDVLRNYDIVANGESTIFTTVTAGRVNSGFVGNTGTIFTGASINVTGNVLSAGGIFNALTVNGNETVTGYLNVTGNILGAGAIFSSINSSGYINSAGNISTPQLNAGQINTSGNVLSAGGVLNELTVNGNVTHAGGRRETGYQFSAPTANVAVAALPTKSRLLLTPTGTIISFGANVTLPGGNVDGTTFSISSNVATTLAVYGQVGTSVSPGANVQLTAGTSVSYLYYATAGIWYKIS
jgi:hypothetical protein